MLIEDEGHHLFFLQHTEDIENTVSNPDGMETMMRASLPPKSLEALNPHRPGDHGDGYSLSRIVNGQKLPIAQVGREHQQPFVLGESRLQILFSLDMHVIVEIMDFRELWKIEEFRDTETQMYIDVAGGLPDLFHGPVGKGDAEIVDDRPASNAYQVVPDESDDLADKHGHAKWENTEKPGDDSKSVVYEHKFLRKTV
jgi:hypothetical protein